MHISKWWRPGTFVEWFALNPKALSHHIYPNRQVTEWSRCLGIYYHEFGFRDIKVVCRFFFFSRLCSAAVAVPKKSTLSLSVHLSGKSERQRRMNDQCCKEATSKCIVTFLEELQRRWKHLERDKPSKKEEKNKWNEESKNQTDGRIWSSWSTFLWVSHIIFLWVWV